MTVELQVCIDALPEKLPEDRKTFLYRNLLETLFPVALAKGRIYHQTRKQAVDETY